MTALPYLRVVSREDAPPPLLPPDVDLADFPDVMLNIQWLCDSRWAFTATDSEQIAAVKLHARSIQQKPAATLPEDDVELAFLAGYGRDIPGWLRVKDRAMEGWTLCSDGRFYRRDMSIKALDAWIKRLATRRKQAASVAKRKRVEFNPERYDRPMSAAIDALYAIDPQAPILRNHMNVDPEIEPIAALSPVAQGLGPDNGPAISSDNWKGSEAKQSESSEYISPTASAVGAGQPGKDSRADEAQSGSGQASEAIQAWPPTAWKDFWALWPNKVAKDEAQPVFAELMLRPPIRFDQLISAVIKYTEGKPEGYAWKYPATWLNKRSWTDEWPDKKPPPPRGHSPPSKFRGGPPRQPFQPAGSYRGRP